MNADAVVQCGGVPLIIQCLSSPVRNTVIAIACHLCHLLNFGICFEANAHAWFEANGLFLIVDYFNTICNACSDLLSMPSCYVIKGILLLVQLVIYHHFIQSGLG